MILSRFAQQFVGGILKRLCSVLLAAQLTRLNSGGDHFEIGDWKHCGTIHLQGRPLTPSMPCPSPRVLDLQRPEPMARTAA